MLTHADIHGRGDTLVPCIFWEQGHSCPCRKDRSVLAPEACAAYIPVTGTLGGRLGTPLRWQSMHFIVWMLCLLMLDRKVVSIAATSFPHEVKRGWHFMHEERVSFECGAWHATQLRPS